MTGSCGQKPLAGIHPDIVGALDDGDHQTDDDEIGGGDDGDGLWRRRRIPIKAMMKTTRLTRPMDIGSDDDDNSLKEASCTAVSSNSTFFDIVLGPGPWGLAGGEASCTAIPPVLAFGILGIGSGPTRVQP